MAGKKGRPIGRKSKLTPELQEKIVGVIRAGNYPEVAAQYAGISDRTFYNWMRWGEERGTGPYFRFMQAVKEASVHSEVRAVALVQGHMDKNWVAAMTYLERRNPGRWGRGENRKVEGGKATDEGDREAVQKIAQLSDEDLDVLARFAELMGDGSAGVVPADAPGKGPHDPVAKPPGPANP